MQPTSSMIGHRYRVLDTLGIGGMGVVYRVFDRLTQEYVALKRVLTRPEKLSFDTRVGTKSDLPLALAQEFQTLASLRHPHIIGVLDYGFDELRQPYFTMELLEEPQSIVQAAHDQPLAVQVELLGQLLRALAYLHRRGMLHRDLTPSNVLVIRNSVKVLDFGLSALVEEATDQVGTLGYIAPEVLNHLPATVASDLYSVGAIAYEVFAGHRPFDASSAIALTYKVLRQPPDLAALPVSATVAEIIGRLLAKQPDARYESAADVLQAFRDATGQPLALETQATRESFLQAARFVGRNAELVTFEAALGQAVAGQGGAWLIGGESGVGKSRLVEELRTLALVQGVPVLRGQAISEGSGSYQLWYNILRWLVLLVDLNDFEMSVLATLIPDIASLTEREVNVLPQLDPQANQKQLTSTIREIVFRLHQPILILVEDLHWAGAESLALLAWLTEIAPECPILIVGTYRDDEQPELPTKLMAMHLLKLNRLTENAIAALSESMLGTAGRSIQIVELLQRETEGNVFFLIETIRALAEEAGQLDKIGTVPLPQHILTNDIRQIVERRFNRIPAWARPLLQVAAVAGREIDLVVLHAVEPAGDLQDWLVACAGAAVLEVHHDRWRFAHDKLREGILLNLDEAARINLNRTVALAIESAYRDTTTQAARLAYHWGIVGNAEAEAHHALIAAQTAHRLYARNEAAAYYSQAINALAKLPDTVENRRRRVDAIVNRADASLTLFDPLVHLANLAEADAIARTLPGPNGDLGGDQPRTARILLEIGNAYFALNKMPEAIGYYRQVLTVGHELEDDTLLAQPAGVLGRVLGVQGRYLQAEPLLAQAVAPLARLGNWNQWALTMSVLAIAKAGRGHCAEALAMFPGILERVRAENDYLGISVCYTARCSIYMSMRQENSIAADYIHEILGFIEKIPDLTAVYMPYGYAMWIEGRSGNYPVAFEMMAKLHEVANRAGGTLLLSDTFAYVEAELAFVTENFGDALSLATKALAAAQSTGSVVNEVRVRILLAQITARLTPSAWDQIMSHLETSLRLCEDNDIRLDAAQVHMVWGRLWQERGDSAVARDHFEKAAAQFEESQLTIRLEEAHTLMRELTHD